MAALARGQVVGIAGAGAMGAGIAQVAAAYGHPVLLYDSAEEKAARSIKAMGEELDKRVQKGKLTSEQRNQLLSNIRPAEALSAFKHCDLIIEAIVEDFAAKVELFKALEEQVRPECLLATNTSSLSVTKLGAALKNPKRFAGMHFFNPAPVMPLVEVVSGFNTAPETADTIFDTAGAWGKTPVRAKSSPGFIVNKGARPFYGEPLRMFEEGVADPATIDALMRAAGFKMGPFELIDLIGLDVNLAASRAMWEAYYGEPRYKPSWAVEERVEAGLLGRKTGRGFYEYPREKEAKISIVEPKNKVSHIAQAGQSTLFGGLLERFEAGGVQISRISGLVPAHFLVDDMPIGIAGRYIRFSKGEWAVFDLAFDYRSCEMLAVAGTDLAVSAAADLLATVGIKAVRVEPHPGLVVARTVTMLINEAADSLQRGVATQDDIDRAMVSGLNFPGGPFGWLEYLGNDYVPTAMNMLRQFFGERYRICPALAKFGTVGAAGA